MMVSFFCRKKYLVPRRKSRSEQVSVRVRWFITLYLMALWNTLLKR